MKIATYSNSFPFYPSMTDDEMYYSCQFTCICAISLIICTHLMIRLTIISHIVSDISDSIVLLLSSIGLAFPIQNPDFHHVTTRKVRWGNFGNGVTSEILIFVQHQSARQRDIMFYLG